VRLTLDLRFVPEVRESTDDERYLPLGDMAALGRQPRELARVLWGTRYDTITVIQDELPASGVQAGALGLVSLARTGGLALQVGPLEPVGSSRARFLLRATALFLKAMPAELFRSFRIARKVQAVAADDIALPPSVSNPARVAYLRVDPTILYLGAYVGGAAAHTTGVINGFRDNGLDVHVYAPERPGGIDGAGYTKVPLRQPYHLVHWYTFVDYGERVAEVAASSRPDFVYQRYALGSYAGLELGRRLGVPFVLEYNGSEVWADKHWGAGQLQRVDDLEALELRNVKSASLVVVVSNVLKDQLRDQGVDVGKVLVNPNGVDTERLAGYRDVAAAEWRKRLDLPEAPTIGFIGTFGLWHGVLELPEMIERVAAERPDARWVLVGSGRLHEDVRREVEKRGLADKVELSGIVPHDRALELLSACDFCVSPHVPNPDGSRFFGSPTKLFEYMGLGKAVVASDLEQIGEVIVDGVSGLLHEPGDSAAAAALCMRLIDDEEMRARLGDGALEAASTEYSWTAHTRRILDALET
jgi:glycosyltransferase involved in cell wall biosynthesis